MPRCIGPPLPREVGKPQINEEARLKNYFGNVAHDSPVESLAVDPELHRNLKSLLAPWPNKEKRFSIVLGWVAIWAAAITAYFVFNK